jgi:hypothetical protein
LTNQPDPGDPQPITGDPGKTETRHDGGGIGGWGWRFWLPGKSKRWPADHVICPLEREGCGPHWVRGYEERNPPRCRQHGMVMRRCKGCRHRRV